MLVPREYQRAASMSLFEYWHAHSGNPVIALPTGTGKSIVIADFLMHALQWYPTTRVLILTHVKELIEQNFNKLIEAWPSAPAGVFSAGLRRKDTRKQITFAGAQSIINALDQFGHIDLVGIDEAHLVSPEQETRYQQIIAYLKTVNPNLKVFGLTATWWRKKHGSLANPGGLFTDICYNRTKPEDFAYFISNGWMVPLVTRKTATQLDVSDVSMSGGEFNQGELERAVDDNSVSVSALRELVHFGQNRRAWLIFASGVSHAEHLSAILNSWGIRTGCVSQKTPAGERDEMLKAFKRGEYRCMTNANILTTGFDYPALDLCGMLRPTMSSSLWVQMLGRFMRPSPATGKRDALVLDFAGNTQRLGPVDDPEIPGIPRLGGGGDAPVKFCDNCGMLNYAAARFCDSCGAEFPAPEKLVGTAGTHELMSFATPIFETFKVTNVTYAKHKSRKSGNLSMRVIYYAGLQSFSEYINPESEHAIVRHTAHNWWKQRSPTDPPATLDEYLYRGQELRVPVKIKVWVNRNPMPEVCAYEWN